jgi:hypothetical protein
MTVSRDFWNATFIAGQKEVFIKNYKCFGWIVQQVILPVNSSMVTVCTDILVRTQAPNLALYVRGRATVVNDESGSYPDRLPGLFTKNRPDHPKGITTVKAVEETELWCFNFLINKRHLPSITPIYIEQNQTYQSQQPELLFVCSGQLNDYTSGQEIVDSTALLTAQQPAYILKVENARV